MTYKDDGNPCNYYFVVDDVSEPGNTTVYFTPVLYWKQEQCQSDWSLNINLPWLSELMESTYEVDIAFPGSPQTPQDTHDLLVSAGYVYGASMAKMAGIHGSSSVVVAKPKTAKLSSAFFKDYIQNVMAPDPKFSGIFYAYDGQPAETASLKRGKDWKRAFKKSGTIESLATTYDADLTSGQAGSALQDLVEGDDWHWESTHMINKAYMSDIKSKIVLREFWWIGNQDEDTTIAFITNADDTEIVGICTHID